MADLHPALENVTRLIIGYNSAGVLDYSHLPSTSVATLLIDNASSDDTLKTAQSLGYSTLPMRSNSGYSRAINAGLLQIDTEFALIQNPDLAISPDNIAALLDAARRYPDADVFVPRLIEPDGKEFCRYETRFEKRARHRRPPEGDCCITAISGAALLVRRREFLKSGAFDENIFLYFEDDDLALRYRAQRRPIIFVSAARAGHLGDKSSTVSASILDLKHRSFGWGWGYTMRKHSLGSSGLELAKIAGKLALYSLTLQTAKRRRSAAYLSGFWRAYRGRPAIFPK